jgi:hypothetical protein
VFYTNQRLLESNFATGAHLAEGYIWHGQPMMKAKKFLIFRVGTVRTTEAEREDTVQIQKD